jgi:hypothetical protein
MEPVNLSGHLLLCMRDGCAHQDPDPKHKKDYGKSLMVNNLCCLKPNSNIALLIVQNKEGQKETNNSDKTDN